MLICYFGKGLEDKHVLPRHIITHKYPAFIVNKSCNFYAAERNAQCRSNRLG